MYKKTAGELLDFIKNSPTSFHAAEKMKRRFEEAGFCELKEVEHWDLKSGGKYFVIRNHSAFIGFSIPEADVWKFHIMASHSDSPSFKIKENPEIVTESGYLKLNIEKYGGMLCAPWFDRPLSVAGRIVVREGGKLLEKLVCIDRDLLVIPSVAIHMNREANEGMAYNVQKDMLPLLGCGEKGSFMRLIADQAKVDPENILGHDLFLYNRTPGVIWGAEDEFISCSRLDDLQCAYASMEGFLQAERKDTVAVHCVLDNEEVGSTTRQGAASTFLKDTLWRINAGLGRSYEQYLMTLARSFMISADNGHSVHPNHPEKSDPVNRPVMNKGIVIKFNANQKYCTDAVSGAVFKEICRRADVPYQVFVNRSDVAGGSTLGNISNTQVAVSTVDVGLAQLGMHSPYETGGCRDTEYLIRAVRGFFR